MQPVFQVNSGRTATLSGMTITGSKGSGGGIFTDGALTVTHSTISGNSGGSNLMGMSGGIDSRA